MRPETWLEDLLGSRAKVRILRLFSRDPARTWSEREVARAIGMSPASVHAALRDLRDTGMLRFQRVGRTHVIQFQRELQPAAALRDLFRRERESWEKIEQAIRGAVPPGSACQLFGSTARGTADRESDIDLLVVARSQDAADEAAQRIRERVRKVMPAPLRIIALGEAEFRRSRRAAWAKAAAREGRSLSRTPLSRFL